MEIKQPIAVIKADKIIKANKLKNNKVIEIRSPIKKANSSKTNEYHLNHKIDARMRTFNAREIKDLLNSGGEKTMNSLISKWE